MYKKLTKAEWDNIKMNYIVRADEPSIEKLAKEFKVSKGAISTRCSQEHWVEERNKYQNNIEKEAIDKAQRELMRSLAKKKMQYVRWIDNLVTVAGNKLTEYFKEENPTLTLTVNEIDKLIRLREFLLGTPTSTHLVVRLDKNPKDMSRDERELVRKKLEMAKRGEKVEEVDFEVIK